MSDMPEAMVQAAVNEFRRKANGQVVLVLQGGGALGAYQVGVYQALHEAGVEPDWIIGTSIGAINASIIAGNEPPDRLAKLDEFWKRIRPTHGHSHRLGQDFPRRGRTGRHLSVVSLHFSHPIWRHSGAHKSRWGQMALVSIRPRRSAKHSLNWWTSRSSINGRRGWLSVPRMSRPA